MSKLTKNELKSIVKECLVEILKEGLIDTNKSLYENKTTVSNHSKPKKQKRKSSYLDNVTFGSQQKKKIKTNLSNNAVLNDIFADTAKNTLHEQIAADRRGSHTVQAPVGSDKASKVVANHSPEEIFGAAASKWSSLAFFDQN